ncbi:MAG TPA: hypothetical protein VNZ52_00480 [Candidatus Thermoplasmatota archaeon]|nr:hypothetical protein [Candidatus Thermoplasmatota archaeon]
MGPRQLLLALLAVALVVPLSAGPAVAFIPAAGSFSHAFTPDTNGTAVALGLLQAAPQDVSAVRFLNGTGLTLSADHLRVLGTTAPGVEDENATLTAATLPEISLTNGSASLRLSLAPVPGLAAASAGRGAPNGTAAYAPGALHLTTSGGAFRFSGEAVRLVLFNATGAALASASGGAAAPEGDRLLVEATGNVTLTLTATEAVITPSATPFGVLVRAPLESTPPDAAALLEGPCAGVAARHPPGSLLAGPGLFLLSGEGNGTLLTSEAGPQAVEPCTYLRVQLVTLAVARDGLVRAEGSALWIHAAKLVAPAEGRIGLGPIPLAALFTWGVAIAAFAYPRMKREPMLAKADPMILGTRFAPQRIALALHVAVFLVTLVVWDHACYVRYGTSLGAEMLTGGFSLSTLKAFLVPELLPWVLSVLAFGIPGFLASRAFLTALGAGPAYRGACMAIGHLAVAIFGPAHLLFWADLLARYSLGA